MTTLVKITVALVLVLLLSSCGFTNFSLGEKGNGIIVEQQRAVTDEFTTVSASEGMDVYLTQGSEFDILVKADENIIDLIGTDIRNGKLKIHAIENIGSATTKVYVTLPKVEGLYASSGAHLSAETKIVSKDLDVDASSGAQISANLEVHFVEIEASSGANVQLSGIAEKVDVDGSSGAMVNAKKLESTICNAGASSGSNVRVNVAKNLVAKASSGGNVSYLGDPEVTKNKSVSGSVHRY